MISHYMVVFTTEYSQITYTQPLPAAVWFQLRVIANKETTLFIFGSCFSPHVGLLQGGWMDIVIVYVHNNLLLWQKLGLIQSGIQAFYTYLTLYIVHKPFYCSCHLTCLLLLFISDSEKRYFPAQTSGNVSLTWLIRLKTYLFNV